MAKFRIIGIAVLLGAAFTLAASGEDINGAVTPENKGAVESAVAPDPQGAIPVWDVEFENEMRRDIRALTGFVARELLPAMDRQKEGAKAARVVARFDEVLRGCAGAPGMADYAWALNVGLVQALPLFTALEAMSERDAFVVGQQAAGDIDAAALLSALENHYRRAARWLDDINMAFGEAHPEAAVRIEALRERDGDEKPLHENAEADIYTNGYPFAGIAPLRDPAAIFAPYSVQGRPKPRGFVPLCGQ